MTLTLVSVYQAAYNQAQREFLARLNVGKNVFINEINSAKRHLDSSVETIAKDWALRSAIGQGDDAKSIKSVLFNHGRRINADIALVLNKEFKLIAQYGSQDSAVNSALARNLDTHQQTMAWIALVDDEPFIMSAEPIKAPANIGWLLMGKRLNQPFLQGIKTLISLDINLLLSSAQQNKIILSTSDNNDIVQQHLQKMTFNRDLNGAVMDMQSMQTEDLVVLPFSIFSDLQLNFVVVLQDSIRAWLHTRNVIMLELLPFFVVGILLSLIGSFFIARSITRPVGSLLDASKLVASGNYTDRINVSEKSELGELAREFAKMQNAVMEREQKIKDQAEEIRQTNTIKYQVEIAQKEQQLAASATQAKSRFLANVSHEIRTPLNSIIGFSEVLSDAAASKQDKDRAAMAVQNGGQYLLNIVNDVLDLAKIEAGKIHLNKTDTSFIGLLDEVTSYMSDFASEKKLNFKLQLNYPLPYEFNTDPTRLKQILLNLCNNAIKFTQEGHVDLQVHLDTFRRRFIFVVSDTGAGLSDEQQLRLFTAFSQGNESTSRKYGGTGLGLYISKQLTDLLGGHIKVTSQKGKGSQFAVYMPWVEAKDQRLFSHQSQVQEVRQAKQSPQVPVPELSGHILCVDDNEDNRQLVAYLVNKTGAKLTLANDGQQALDAFEIDTFDLVLMDMQMPEMDGLQATKILIQRGFTQPIVMLTANVDSNSKDKVMAAGAKQHFAKPIDPQHFYAMLRQYLGAEADHQSAQQLAVKAVEVLSDFTPLVAKYLMSFESKLLSIQQALSTNDWSQIQQIIHKIKGSAGSYGYTYLSELAVSVEHNIEQQSWPQAQKSLAEMQDYMQQLYNEKLSQRDQ
jgi:signal transduction histidine kinase/DNA-binding response OmpR family regulator